MKMSRPVASDVRRVSNKYLVKIPTSGTCCVDFMALTTGVFDELKLEYETVDLKTPSEGTEIHWSFATGSKAQACTRVLCTILTRKNHYLKWLMITTKIITIKEIKEYIL